MKLSHTIGTSLLIAASALAMGCASGESDRGRKVYSASVRAPAAMTAETKTTLASMVSILEKHGYSVTTPGTAGKVLSAISKPPDLEGERGDLNHGATKEVTIRESSLGEFHAYDITFTGWYKPLVGKHPWNGVTTVCAEMSAEQLELLKVLSP